MVQPLTSALVGTKMEKLKQQNIYQTTNQQTSEHDPFYKERYKKACLKLNEIEVKRQRGTFDPEKDEEARAKWQLVVDDYREYIKRENIDEVTFQLKSEAYLRERYNRGCRNHQAIEYRKQHGISKAGDENKRIKWQTAIDEYLEYKKRNIESNHERIVFTENLCVALACNTNGQLQAADKADWPKIEIELSKILLRHLLNARGSTPIPHYDSGEIYRGFFLIKCKDEFSKKFLSQCMEKIRNAFEGKCFTIIQSSEVATLLDPCNAYRKQIEQPLASNFQQNQGFQLSKNYFETDEEEDGQQTHDSGNRSNQNEDRLYLTKRQRRKLRNEMRRKNASMEHNNERRESSSNYSDNFDSNYSRSDAYSQFQSSGSRPEFATTGRNNFDTSEIHQTSENYEKNLYQRRGSSPNNNIGFTSNFERFPQSRDQSAERFGRGQYSNEDSFHNSRQNYHSDEYPSTSRGIQTSMAYNNSNYPSSDYREETTTKTTTSKREIAQTARESLKPKADLLHKSTSNQQPVSEVIVLSDDDCETFRPEIKIYDQNKERRSGQSNSSTTKRTSWETERTDSNTTQTCKRQEFGEQPQYWRTGNDINMPSRAQSSGGWRSNTSQNTPNNAGQWNEFSDSTSNPDLQIAIIDRNQNDGKISKADWLIIEDKLLNQLFEEMQQIDNNNIRMFNSGYWRYGIKIIQCENFESINFIRRFIHNQRKYWQNTNLDVIPASELPKSSIIKVCIPPPFAQNPDIMNILISQNSMLYSSDWSLINSRERNDINGKDLYIIISPSSLECLKRTNGEIRLDGNYLKSVLIE